MPIIAPAREWRVTLQSTTLADLRRRARDALAAWGIVPDDLVLIVDELVTNAVVHGLPPVEIAVRLDRAVLIEVSDTGPGEPHITEVADDHGRGLTIVAHLADAVAVTTHEHGKTVWARAAA
jgi:anti-sigma regulatory factor (Ser/Thr protein kinase)